MPSKAKTWTALIGSFLTFGIPLVLQLSTSLPPEYQAMIGGVVALLTAFGVYHAPYAPTSEPPPAPQSGRPQGGTW